MSIFKNIRAMHAKFHFTRYETPRILPHKLQQFRIDFIQEELDELKVATKENDMLEVVDALIDIMVVAAGTLDLMGVDGQAHWNEVHWCNMNKQRATQDKMSKRGSVDMDLVKPDGWVGPDHGRIIND